MALNIGEDLFAAMLAVSLVAIFTAALVHSYHLYSERRNGFDDFDLALDIAEQLRDRVLAAPGNGMGLLEPSMEKLENYSRRLTMEGVNLRVEIRSVTGELVLGHGREPDAIQNYLSPAAGVSLPVAVKCGNGSARPCELSVQVWRG